MHSSEALKTIGVLSRDAMPDHIEMVYLTVCLGSKSPMAKEIISIKGKDWFDTRMVFVFKKIMPVLMERLEKTYVFGIDHMIEAICMAREQFQPIAEIVDITNLAQARKIAHVRAGCEAVKYLMQKDEVMRDPYRKVLYSAILAGINPNEISSPSSQMQKDAREHSKDNEVIIKRTVRLNGLLNFSLHALGQCYLR